MPSTDNRTLRQFHCTSYRSLDFSTLFQLKKTHGTSGLLTETKTPKNRTYMDKKSQKCFPFKVTQGWNITNGVVTERNVS